VLEVRLTQPSAVLPTVLASIASFAAIYPKEVVEATGDGQLKEYVGTGPFKFAEHRPDRHIRLVRFDGYAARPEAASGLGGQRAAHLDEILFLPVPDYATRQAGMQTGEYDSSSRSNQTSTIGSGACRVWSPSSPSRTGGRPWFST
jgi:peptide/nickel transport system substrate-binding protein